MDHYLVFSNPVNKNAIEDLDLYGYNLGIGNGLIPPSTVSGMVKSVIGGASYSAGSRSDELEIIWEQVKNCIVTYSRMAIYAENDEEFNDLVDEMPQKIAMERLIP